MCAAAAACNLNICNADTQQAAQWQMPAQIKILNKLNLSLKTNESNKRIRATSMRLHSDSGYGNGGFLGNNFDFDLIVG